MKRTLLLSLLLGLSALPAMAGTIESEPLPPPSWQKSETVPKVATPAPDAQSSATIPMTTRTGAPATNGTAPSPSTTDPDSGMSGTTGASSAYDLGATKTPPADITPQSSGASSAPMSITPNDEPAPYVQPTSQTIRMGIEPKDDPKLSNKKFCTLKVSFGSIGTGVDKNVGEQVKKYLDANTSKITFTRDNWGREGEYDYCIDIPEHNNRAVVYRELKRLLPAKGKEANGPYTQLSGAGFTSVTTAR